MDESRRKSTRWPVVSRVDFVDMYGRAWVGLIKDLSPDGLFVQYAPELRVGSTVGASFALPGHETFKLMAKVVRATPKGVGLKFIGRTGDTQNPHAKSLQAYCAELHEAWKKGTDSDKKGTFQDAALEKLVPADHPLLPVLSITKQVMRALSDEFSGIHLSDDCLAIPPEQLLRATLVKALYSIRSERLLLEQLQYNLLIRGFVGIERGEKAWGVKEYVENRDRLLRTYAARCFLAEVARLTRGTGVLSDDHFAVDWGLFDAWISMVSPSILPESPSMARRRGKGSHAMC